MREGDSNSNNQWKADGNSFKYFTTIYNNPFLFILPASFTSQLSVSCDSFPFLGEVCSCISLVAP